jgi:hypothetical protein
MPLPELFVRLSEAQALERTENDFRTTPPITWRPTRKQLNNAWTPPGPPPDRKREAVWTDDEVPRAKHACVDKPDGSWDSYDAGSWKKTSTWDDSKHKDYGNKADSWKDHDDSWSKSDDPQHDSYGHSSSLQQWKKWHPSTPQHVRDQYPHPGGYWEDSRDKQDIMAAIEASKQALLEQSRKIEDMEKKARDMR